MEFLIFIAVTLGALFTIASVFQVAAEIRRLRVLFEVKYNLEPQTKESFSYKKKQAKFEDV
tara:strand:+ start:140 stop:322 length:183 start_codon:yes stop_codon:yes gene_type:complete